MPRYQKISGFERSITRAKLRKFFRNEAQAAEWFGLDRQAIYQWPEDECIPHLRELQLRVEFPNVNWDAL